MSATITTLHPVSFRPYPARPVKNLTPGEWVRRLIEKNRNRFHGPAPRIRYPELYLCSTILMR
jgi:hypothetical protein